MVYDPNAPKNEGSDAQSKDNQTDTAPEEPANALFFEANGAKVRVYDRAEDAIAALGKPNSSFEAPSCAYQGMDIFYLYNGFQLTVNDLNGEDHVTVIIIVDDTVSIPQGVTIGTPKEKMLELMGDNFNVSEGVYEFISGYTTLQIQIKDDAVASILYVYICRPRNKNSEVCECQNRIKKSWVSSAVWAPSQRQHCFTILYL